MMQRRSLLRGLALSAVAGSPIVSVLAKEGVPAARVTRSRLRLIPIAGTKIVIFDGSAGYGKITNIANFTDATVVKRGDRWWMFGAGLFKPPAFGINLASACLAPGAPLSAKGWTISTKPNAPTQAAELIPFSAQGRWDVGRHCPSYARGWDPSADNGRGAWRERIYYTGTPTAFAGPYTNGFAEWDGERWAAQEKPVFEANEPWEFGNVAEPNVIYHRGKWHMWYCAGPNPAKQYAQGYAVSADGKTNWKRKLFCPADEQMFDHAVIAANGRLEAVSACLAFLHERNPEPQDGLWWSYSIHGYGDRSNWSAPQQILNDTTNIADWHAGGVWKPSFQYSETNRDRMFVFFDAAGRPVAAGKRPVFSVGCIECRLME